MLLISCKLWEAWPTSQISQVRHASITIADKAESHTSLCDTSEEIGSSAKTCQGGKNPCQKKRQTRDSESWRHNERNRTVRDGHSPALLAASFQSGRLGWRGQAGSPGPSCFWAELHQFSWLATPAPNNSFSLHTWAKWNIICYQRWKKTLMTLSFFKTSSKIAPAFLDLKFKTCLPFVLFLSCFLSSSRSFLSAPWRSSKVWSDRICF